MKHEKQQTIAEWTCSRQPDHLPIALFACVTDEPVCAVLDGTAGFEPSAYDNGL